MYEVESELEAELEDLISNLLESDLEAEAEAESLAPKGLVLLDHIHTPKVPDPARPGAFITSPLTSLVPANMNPLFFQTDTTVIADTSPTGLQHCLDVLVARNFAGLLGSRGQTAPGAGDRIHIALVDLTGNRLTAPDFAGWGAPVDMYGASVPKILALHSACQLRSDLRNLVVRKSLQTGKDLEQAAIAEWKIKGLARNLPDLVWLFDIRKWTPAASLDFTVQAQSTFAHISDNRPASTLIEKVGLPYIGSVTWQSGLYHHARSGLWLKAGYSGRGGWVSPVKTPFIHNATALSVATYFTLLAQRRLVDDASSIDIRNALLAGGCVTNHFPPLPFIASKCGIYDGWIHDCAWIQDSNVSYVVAVLSRLATQAHRQLYKQLCSGLDALIRQNNRSPKSPC